MDSTLLWNITCPLNDTAEDVADIVAQCVYDGTVGGTDGLQYVYVYQLCGVMVSSTPYPSERRLQAEESEIKLKSVVTKTCNGCENDMYNEAKSALDSIVKDGSLSDNIQDKSGDTITAVVDPTIFVSNYEVITNPPSAAPTTNPTSSPSVDIEDPGSSDPTSSPVNKAPPAPNTVVRISLGVVNHMIIDFSLTLHSLQRLICSHPIHLLRP